jgi:hypothetical protein
MCTYVQKTTGKQQLGLFPLIWFSIERRKEVVSFIPWITASWNAEKCLATVRSV